MLRSLAFPLFLAVAACLAPACAWARFYVVVDGTWYPVDSGGIEVDPPGELVDVIGALITSCKRANGGSPNYGDLALILGDVVLDVIYSQEPVAFYFTTPLVLEFKTPSGDVNCGPGVTPPAPLVAAIGAANNAASELFSDSFE